MPALAQDILTAGIALAVYALGALLILGRCRHLTPPFPPSSNDNGPAMRTQPPTAEPLDVTALSIAAGMGVIAVLCAVAAVACARAWGVL